MLLVKLHDNTFSLGGRGTEVEFCFLCHALRVFCSFHLSCDYCIIVLTMAINRACHRKL